jgi:outer membrane protein insertion porin family
MPLVQGVVALDGFFDAAAIKKSPNDLFNNLSMNDFYFSYGVGLRFSMPQFPLRLLFPCKFRVIDGQVEWPYGKSAGFTLSFNLINQ